MSWTKIINNNKKASHNLIFIKNQIIDVIATIQKMHIKSTIKKKS